MYKHTHTGYEKEKSKHRTSDRFSSHSIVCFVVLVLFITVLNPVEFFLHIRQMMNTAKEMKKIEHDKKEIIDSNLCVCG